MSIIEEVCGVKGHNLQSLVVGQVIEPVTKFVLNRSEIRCTQCGKTLEEVLKYRVGGTGLKRREKRKPRNESASHLSSASQASENSGNEPIPSPLGVLPESGL
jgi:hypothetical protein